MDWSNCSSFDCVTQSSIMSLVEAEEAVSLNLKESEDKAGTVNITNLFNNSFSSYYKDNVLYYLCGIILKTIVVKLKCEECIELLFDCCSNLSPHTRFMDLVSKVS